MVITQVSVLSHPSSVSLIAKIQFQRARTIAPDVVCLTWCSRATERILK
jgi:hypothetical protein